MTSQLRTKTAIVSLIAMATAGATGCYARFDVDATRARYRASGVEPACAAAIVAKQQAYNDHGRWWARSVVAGVVLGAALGGLGIATGRDTPGAGAADLEEAVAAEEDFSRLELATAAVAMAAAGDALLAWYSTARMAQRATEVAELITRCPVPSP